MWRMWGPVGAAAFWVEQCNDSCLLALHHLYAHNYLQTQHDVCLPFLNDSTRQCSVAFLSRTTKKRREKKKKILLWWRRGKQMHKILKIKVKRCGLEVQERSWWGHWRTCYHFIFHQRALLLEAGTWLHLTCSKDIFVRAWKVWEIQIKPNTCSLTSCTVAVWCCRRCTVLLSEAMTTCMNKMLEKDVVKLRRSSADKRPNAQVGSVLQCRFDHAPSSLQFNMMSKRNNVM